MNVGFISLGCSKNLIDTEATIGMFKKHNFKVVNNEEKADILVINTCGFIESAKEEAISTILEMAEYKNRNCKYLIVMGCLVQRYYDELVKALPEVDLFVKIEDYDTLWEQIEDLIKRDIVIRKKKTSHINMALFLILMISSFCFVVSGFYNVGKDIIAGVDSIKWSFSLSVAIANVMSWLSSSIVVFVKTYNIIMGKKKNMTEEEYGNYRANKKKSNQ